MAKTVEMGLDLKKTKKAYLKVNAIIRNLHILDAIDKSEDTSVIGLVMYLRRQGIREDRFGLATKLKTLRDRNVVSNGGLKRGEDSRKHPYKLVYESLDPLDFWNLRRNKIIRNK